MNNFVLETKGDIRVENLKPSESVKIACGRKHFQALASEVIYKDSDDFKDFIEKEWEKFFTHRKTGEYWGNSRLLILSWEERLRR